MVLRHYVLVPSPDHLCQDVPVHVIQLVEVQAGGAGLVLAESGKQPFGNWPFRNPVQHQVRFSWRKSDGGSIAFAAGPVLVVVAAEPDDRGTPHDRFLTRGFTHHVQQLQAVRMAGGVLDGGQEFFNGHNRGLGLVLCHDRSFADVGHGRQHPGDSLPG